MKEHILSPLPMRFVLLAVLLTAADALAQNNAEYRLTGPTTTTNVSGRGGSHSFTLASDINHSMLGSMAFWENRNDPCQIRASFWAEPNGAGSRTTSNVESNNLAPYGFGCNGIARDYESISAPSMGITGRSAFHGVQVCSNDRSGNNYKLKGVRALVSVLNRDGQGRVRRDPGLAVSFSRSNCREWEQVRRCPAGQVAVGVQVFYQAFQSNITGLALRCRAVDIAPLK